MTRPVRPRSGQEFAAKWIRRLHAVGAVTPSICRVVLLVVSVISLARAEERVPLDIYILVSDIHVKQIEAKRTITIGLPFSFEDLQNEAPASAIKTSVSGTCELRDGAYHQCREL